MIWSFREGWWYQAQQEGEKGSWMRLTISKLITSNTFSTQSFALTCQGGGRGPRCQVTSHQPGR